MTDRERERGREGGEREWGGGEEWRGGREGERGKEGEMEKGRDGRRKEVKGEGVVIFTEDSGVERNILSNI